MFKLIKQHTLLTVFLNNQQVCEITRKDIPCDLRPSLLIPNPPARIIFQDPEGRQYIHSLEHEKGWMHLSIRVHKSLACEIDCVISTEEHYDEGDFRKGKLKGVRFQPFYLPDSKYDYSMIEGKGLFSRGLHFSGTVTPANVSLSCICDQCEKSFRIKSFHTGFNNIGYFYSDSSMQTLVVDSSIEGAPPPTGKPDLEKLSALESILPLADDGTKFRYLNPFRCPHCSAAYIDFERYPQQREIEYYGNFFIGDGFIKFNPD